MASLLDQARRPKRRPVNLDKRLNETLEALRYVRVNAAGVITLLTRDNDADPPGTSHIFPSLAVYQLYLLNDTSYGAHYIDTPLTFSAAGVVNYAASILTIQKLVQTLVDVARRLRDIGEKDNASALRTVPALYARSRDIYVIVRADVLKRMDALRGAPLNAAVFDYIVNERWRDRVDIQRVIARNDRTLVDLRAQLRLGGKITLSQQNAVMQQVITEIDTTLVAELIREAKAMAEEPPPEPRVTPSPAGGGRPPPTPARRTPRPSPRPLTPGAGDAEFGEDMGLDDLAGFD
jgi:hypothetical protein